MRIEQRIYLLDPQKLAPETIAVAFAKTSRSPEPFDQIASELTREKSSEFNEKWVVGYGHSSVAEHAVLHIAVENVSRLAVENLQSNRLASYTEKSTRYQTWDAAAYLTPDELQDHPLREDFILTANTLFGCYERLIPEVKRAIEKESPRQKDENDTVWKRHTLSKAIDICRFVLPAASLANVGMTINARALEHAISKMLTSPLLEVQRMGASIKEIAQNAVPTLVKYARESAYLKKTETLLLGISSGRGSLSKDWCQLVHGDADGEKRILTAALYRFQSISYAQALEQISALSAEEKDTLARAILADRERFAVPLRELEHAHFSFDITLDQGAFYEVKRHRMMTLTPQGLSTRLGYALPRAISASGMEETYRYAMERAQDLYEQMRGIFPAAASYIVPNAFNRRFLITSNLRSLIHFIALRSAPNAHFSVRRLAQRMAEELERTLPIFGKYLLRCSEETSASIEKDYFSTIEMR
ncbi:MAG: FAD-dependent thymidylate synthase [Chloroflexi bacterium]|nr:FAD-dependent thymidylate synthase [Chloroflexota bacterium]